MKKYIRDRRIMRCSFIAISALVCALGMMAILFAFVGILATGETNNLGSLWVDIVIIMTVGLISAIGGLLGTIELMTLGGKG